MRILGGDRQEECPGRNRSEQRQNNGTVAAGGNRPAGSGSGSGSRSGDGSRAQQGQRHAGADAFPEHAAQVLHPHLPLAVQLGRLQRTVVQLGQPGRLVGAGLLHQRHRRDTGLRHDLVGDGQMGPTVARLHHHAGRRTGLLLLHVRARRSALDIRLVGHGRQVWRRRFVRNHLPVRQRTAADRGAQPGDGHRIVRRRHRSLGLPFHR